MNDDASLVHAYKEGDKNAFEELYARHVQKLFGAVYVKTYHAQTAEDIVSQTFLQALEHLHSFNPKRGSFGGWLHRIARNLIADHYRSLRPTQSADDVWDLANDDDVPRDADTAMKMQQVQKELTALNTTQRDIVLLRIWHNYSFADIADALEMTEAACKMSYKRSIVKLQALLGTFLLLFHSFHYAFFS